jgi:hypothetical protein
MEEDDIHFEELVSVSVLKRKGRRRKRKKGEWVLLRVVKLQQQKWQRRH